MSWSLDWRRKKQIIKLEIKLILFSEDLSLLAAFSNILCVSQSLPVVNCDSASLVRSSGHIWGWRALCLVPLEVTKRVRLVQAYITQAQIVLPKKKYHFFFFFTSLEHLCSNICVPPPSLALLLCHEAWFSCVRTGYCYGNEWKPYKAAVMRTRQSEASCGENLILKHLCCISNKGAAGKGQQSLWMALCMQPTAYPRLANKGLWLLFSTCWRLIPLPYGGCAQHLLHQCEIRSVSPRGQRYFRESMLLQRLCHLRTTAVPRYSAGSWEWASEFWQQGSFLPRMVLCLVLVRAVCRLCPLIHSLSPKGMNWKR